MEIIVFVGRGGSFGDFSSFLRNRCARWLVDNQRRVSRRPFRTRRNVFATGLGILEAMGRRFDPRSSDFEVP